MPAPPIYASFVGTFVMAVGLSYLYPFCSAPSGGYSVFSVLFEVTAISRLAVAGFLTVAILNHALGLTWGLVLLTDLGLAAFQLVYLRRHYAAPNGAGEAP